MTATFAFSEFDLKIKRATGRAIVGIGVAIATETKRVTHVKYGDLRRSVHAAPLGYDGGDDEVQAQRGEDLLHEMVPEPTHTATGPSIEVGSWMPYACVEWVGRGHPGVTQGLEMVRGARADAIVLQAFREEGLA